MAMLFGTGVLCAIDIAIALRYWAPVGAGYLAAGAAVYLVTSVGVTMLGNVPLNVALAKTQSHTAEDWVRYRKAWMRWNHVRTIGCAAAAGLIIQAMASGGLWYFLLNLRA
jgi:uncharacterized membrane protein